MARSLQLPEAFPRPSTFPPRMIRSFRIRNHCRALVLLALFPSWLTSPAGAEDDPRPQAAVTKAPPTTMDTFTVEESAATKTHTLFMGADIAVDLDRDLYPVHDVVGSSWVVRINGRDRVISAKRAPLSLKITPSLKLTETGVNIVGFQKIPTFSFANDPSVKLTHGLNQSSMMNADLQAIASQAQARADTSANSALGGAAVLAGSDDQFSANALMTTAQFAYSNSHPTQLTTGPIKIPLPNKNAPSTTTSTTGSLVNPLADPALSVAPSPLSQFRNDTDSLNTGIVQNNANTAAHQTKNGDEPTGRLTNDGRDALEIAFEVQSGKSLQNPYVVTMTRFRSHAAKTGLIQNLVYAQSLHPIDKDLSHVDFIEEGFPNDYEIVDFQLHLYDNGVEVATNLAANRVELTRDEAFEYVKMEYLDSHRHDTVPATAAMGRMPAELTAALAAGKYRDPVYVRVSKDGLADEAYADPACTRLIADPLLEAVVKRVRFKPALAAGVPVEGNAALNLNQLAL